MPGPDGWIKNLGSMPGNCRGQRIYVHLRCGMMPKEAWPADGKQGLRWTLDGHPFDVTHWKPS